jgi:hypothetical protein
MLERFLHRNRAADPLPPPPTETLESEAQERWSRLRAPPTDQDRVLLSQTHLWLRLVPTPLHPKHLCRYHPRIANRLAQAWADHDETDRVFEGLLYDHRRGRKGFTERVKMEIVRLESFHARRPRLTRLRPLAERLRGWASARL